jgi:hypothetical protein
MASAEPNSQTPNFEVGLTAPKEARIFIEAQGGFSPRPGR